MKINFVCQVWSGSISCFLMVRNTLNVALCWREVEQPADGSQRIGVALYKNNEEWKAHSLPPY